MAYYKPCMECGKSIPAQAKKCRHCGAAVRPRKCPRCGKRKQTSFIYFQGWDTDTGVAWGFVCASCDRVLGHENLVAAGLDDLSAHEENMAIIGEANGGKPKMKRGTRPW